MKHGEVYSVVGDKHRVATGGGEQVHLVESRAQVAPSGSLRALCVLRGEYVSRERLRRSCRVSGRQTRPKGLSQYKCVILWSTNIGAELYYWNSYFVTAPKRKVVAMGRNRHSGKSCGGGQVWQEQRLRERAPFARKRSASRG